MILNQAENIMYGSTQVQKVFLGTELIWQRYQYDETKIAVVELDEAYLPTDKVQYFTTLADAVSAVQNGSADFYGLYIGQNSGVLSVPDGTFANCSKIGAFRQGSVTSIGGGAFYRASNLNEISLSEGILSIGDGAFNGTAVRTLNFPATLTSCGRGIVQACLNLESFTVPLCVTEIYSSEFTQCNSLTEVIITENVRGIRSNAFYQTPSLTEITIPATVETIEGTPLSGAFYMSSLQRIIINKPESSISGAPWGAVNAEIIWTGE